jgi:V/A-type H+-transporting ATPase subunit K
MSEQNTRRSRLRRLVALSSVVVLATVITIFLINVVQTVSEVRGRNAIAASAQPVSGAQGTQAENPKSSNSQATGWGFIAAALSTGVGCIAAGIAVASVGAAGIAVVGEKPDLMARALIFVGLAEGIAIYGLIISIMILTRI